MCCHHKERSLGVQVSTSINLLATTLLDNQLNVRVCWPHQFTTNYRLPSMCQPSATRPSKTTHLQLQVVPANVTLMVSCGQPHRLWLQRAHGGIKGAYGATHKVGSPCWRSARRHAQAEHMGCLMHLNKVSVGGGGGCACPRMRAHTQT